MRPAIHVSAARTGFAASSAKLSGARNRYKIKLRAVGYRLLYEVRDAQLIVVVVAVGKRERGAAYRLAPGRKGGDIAGD